MTQEHEHPRFENALTEWIDGQEVRYLVDPLADEYLVAPGEAVPRAMLPPEEWEVRNALIEMKFATERVAEMGLIARTVNRAEYDARWQAAVAKQKALRELVQSTRAHRAALRRIVSVMPADGGGREVLAPYLQ